MPNQFTSPPAYITCETCGTVKRVKAYKIGTARFCSRKCQGAPSVKHGEARNGKRTPEYSIWQAMIDRCQSPGNPFYADYAGRGITVCDAWRSYENFIHDMGRRPSADLSLERLDNDRGYSPDNCAWRTRTQQQRNKRDNAYLTINGETRLRIEWAELMGINHETLRYRLRAGWSPERAVGLSR